MFLIHDSLLTPICFLNVSDREFGRLKAQFRSCLYRIKNGEPIKQIKAVFAYYILGSYFEYKKSQQIRRPTDYK